MFRNKLDDYTRIWRTLLQLRLVQPGEVIDRAVVGEQNLYNRIHWLAQLLWADQSPLLPFEIKDESALRTGFQSLLVSLDVAIEHVSADNSTAVLNDAQWRELQVLITEFQWWFEKQTSGKAVFVTTADQESLLRYLEPLESGGWVGRRSTVTYYRLPRVTQALLSGAGRSLAYRQIDSVITQLLPAVETAIRYLFGRNSGNLNHKRRFTKSGDAIPFELNQMIEYLLKQSVIDSKQASSFHRLRKSYRNVVMHGRSGKTELTLQSVETLFKKCWNMIGNLYRDLRSHPELRVQLSIPNDFDFDTALATFIYRDNNELPSIEVDAIQFGERLTHSGYLCDNSLKPQSISLIGSAESPSIAMQVLDRLLFVDPSYRSRVRPLLNCVIPGKMSARESRRLQNAFNALERGPDSATRLGRVWDWFDKQLLTFRRV